MSFNFTDFYIGYPGHPRFKESALIEDDVVRVIVQKYEMILFTNKGDVFGAPNFGSNLEELLHETKLSAETIESVVYRRNKRTRLYADRIFFRRSRKASAIYGNLLPDKRI